MNRTNSPLGALDRRTSKNGDLVKQGVCLASFHGLPVERLCRLKNSFRVLRYSDRFMSIRSAFNRSSMMVSCHSRHTLTFGVETHRCFQSALKANDTRPVLAIPWQCTHYHSSADDIRHADDSNIHHENSSLLSEGGVIHFGPVCFTSIPITLTIQHRSTRSKPILESPARNWAFPAVFHRETPLVDGLPFCPKVRL